MNNSMTSEAFEQAAKETQRLQQELDITNADHIALWLEANTIQDEPMNQCASWLACRIVEAHETALALSRPQPIVTTDGLVEEEIDAILAKSDDEVTLDSLREMFGADISEDSHFTLGQMMAAMDHSFEQGKELIQLLRKVDVQSLTEEKASLERALTEARTAFKAIADTTFIGLTTASKGTLIVSVESAHDIANDALSALSTTKTGEIPAA